MARIRAAALLACAAVTHAAAAGGESRGAARAQGAARQAGPYASTAPSSADAAASWAGIEEVDPALLNATPGVFDYEWASGGAPAAEVCAVRFCSCLPARIRPASSCADHAVPHAVRRACSA